MTIGVRWLFLTVPWVGLQYVVVVFPGHTYLFFTANFNQMGLTAMRRGLHIHRWLFNHLYTDGFFLLF